MTREVGESLFPKAVYRDQVVAAYRGNAFIEALPDILGPVEEIRRMQRVVTATDEDRAAPSHIRAHMIEAIHGGFLQPLEQHIEISGRISTMLRAGYVGRDPRRPEFLWMLGAGAAALAETRAYTAPRQVLSPGRGMALVGMSGVGKTTAIAAVLSGYPQVIWHPILSSGFQSMYQLVWLKLTCPVDGSIKALCRSFFSAVDGLLGTNYHRLYAHNGTVESMRDAMARVAFLHGLGLLVIDEVQNLLKARGASAQVMMNFFLVLRDDMKVPVLTVGTRVAEGILGGNFQVARRHTGMPVFDRMRLGDEFELFCESLFGAQYLRVPIQPGPDLLSVLYELSQGITDIVIKLFVLGQLRALAMNTEELTIDLLQAVYLDCLVLLHPFLEDIRTGRPVDEVLYDLAVKKSSVADLAPVAERVQPAYLSTRAKTTRTAPSVEATTPSVPGTTSSAKLDISATPQTSIRKLKTKKACQSACELVRTVEGKEGAVDPHGALLAAGFIWNVGADVIGGA